MRNNRVSELKELINITNKLTGDYNKDVKLIGEIKNGCSSK